ncbi:MAG TPA: glycoside hydrolase family 2 TIM barrel-domain containing protein [Bacteroidota bacterium]|nr:glycoside hydrolase family 2 TIM barrel-domain containing protein [Bacteroidota bacterium]
MKKKINSFFINFTLAFLTVVLFVGSLSAQTAMVNVDGRNTTSLNGKWTVLLDPTGDGDWKQVWQERKPHAKTEFVEYSFDGGPKLNVPGDFNSQLRELTYFEGTVWYKKQFSHPLRNGRRLFLHFGAVNYIADVYLNGEKLGSHEGGFTPFQFEITGKVKDGMNSLIVKADNRRKGNGLPGYGYDWFNYGGITRDVHLIETSNTYIEDYFIQLKKGSLDTVSGWVQLNGAQASHNIEIQIPELKLSYKTSSNEKGWAKIEFSAAFKLWSPEHPNLYSVIVKSETDTVADRIGFRSIEVQGSMVLLNKKTVFLKGVNIHEENPYKKARAYSTDDALVLLNAAKELGCNFVRLAHYPHNEHTIRQAEKMGLLVWSEIPVYQHIQFSDSLVPKKLETMLGEMIRRDKNRCCIINWCLSNETYPGTPNRTEALVSLTLKCRQMDSTRLVSHVINTQEYANNKMNVWDTLYRHSDIIALNEYVGWYLPWQGKPTETKWQFVCPGKPVLISEFGGEALYGSNKGPADEAAYWTEGYQEQIYVNQITMFDHIPNLCGVCPWLLFDYRSLGRMNQVYQNGYNRKGLLSEKGQKKKAWYVMREYFHRKK